MEWPVHSFLSKNRHSFSFMNFPNNRIMQRLHLKSCIITLLILCLFSFSDTIAQKGFSKLVWADEFSGSGLPDSSKWSYDVGANGWGNNELQFYTSQRKENARVENGYLIIEAIKEKFDSAQFTSARLVSKNKGDWKYGRIEVRAKLPSGKGLWPAIWMLPTTRKYGGWPHSGEIDIMENVGYWPDSLFGTIHTGSYNGSMGTQKSNSLAVRGMSNSFNVFAVEWTPEVISFFVNQNKYGEFKNEHTGSSAWPFDQEFHLLLNIAVGGNWGGKFGVDETVFPQQMIIDYVRVYQ